MANPITTTGTTGGPVVTTYAAPELVRTWVARHSTAVTAAGVTGNKLTTTWTGQGGPGTCTTNRLAGESDSAFLARHITEYSYEMGGNQPIP